MASSCGHRTIRGLLCRRTGREHLLREDEGRERGEEPRHVEVVQVRGAGNEGGAVLRYGADEQLLVPLAAEAHVAGPFALDERRVDLHVAAEEVLRPRDHFGGRKRGPVLLQGTLSLV